MTEPSSNPRPRVDQLTDDQLDQLYARLEHVEQVAGRCFEAGHEKDLDRWRHRAEQAEDAIARVRALHEAHSYPDPDMPGMRTYCVGCEDATSEHPCTTVAALDGTA